MDHDHLYPRPITLGPPFRTGPSVPRRRRPSWYDRTQACWALAPTEQLAVFVHGFGGDALGTWRQFSDLWPRGRAGYDLVFYGYDSLHRQALYSGDELREFLEAFLAAPAAMINPTIEHLTHVHPRILRPAFTYRKVVFVAHSLGAVVVRQALVEAEQNKPAWITRSELALFAPAHKGAHVIRLVFTGLTGIPFGPLLTSLVQTRISALEGLQKGSTELNGLETRTLEAIGARGNLPLEPLRAGKVVFPEYEQIVIQDHFGKDVGANTSPGCRHTDVCKPQHDFMDPIKAVEPLL
jgi:pimeloyl-ACP methyl ester carboxylesterase